MKYLPKQFKLVVRTKEQGDAIQNRLFELGYCWTNCEKNVSLCNDFIVVGKYNEGKMQYCGYLQEGYKDIPTLSFDQLYILEKKESSTDVELNDDLFATVTQKTVNIINKSLLIKHVCSIDIIDKLVEARNKLK